MLLIALSAAWALPPTGGAPCDPATPAAIWIGEGGAIADRTAALAAGDPSAPAALELDAPGHLWI